MENKGRRFADEREDTRAVEKHAQSDPAGDKRDKKALQKEQRLKEKNAKKLDKLMKKQQKREKHSKRDVLTYEELPIEERESDIEKSTPKIKISKKRIIAAVLIILLLFVVVFYIANPERMSFYNIKNFFNYSVMNRDSDQKFPIDVSGESISPGNFVGSGLDIVYSSETKTQILNNYGRSVFTAPHAFITPVLVCGGKNEIIYNLGGTGYQVIDKESNVSSFDAKDDILLADITESGVYAIVTESGGYLSKLYVYDQTGEQIYAYSFADYYVTAVSLSNTGKQAVVAGISALDGVDIAALYVLDFTKDSPLYFSEFEDNIIYDVQYINDHSAAAVGRAASYAINTSNGNVETNAYEGRVLTAYDINTDTDTYTLSLSNSGDGRNCDIISFNSSGKKDRSFSVDDKIIDLSTHKGRVALLTNDDVMLYSKDGKHYSTKSLRSDPHTVVLYTGSDAYVLCTGYIDTISL